MGMTETGARQVVRRLGRSGLAAALSMAAGCGLVDSEADGWRTEFDQARSLWDDAGLTDYRYVVRQLCFCGFGGERVAVEVRNGEVVSGTLLDTGEVVDAAQWPSAAPSVDALFDRIEGILDNDPNEFNATYHPQLGYPVSVSSDPIENADDEEWGVETSGLEEVR